MLWIQKIYKKQIEEEEEQNKQNQDQKENQQNKQQLVNELTSFNLGLYKKGIYVKKIVIKDFTQQIRNDYPMILVRSEVGEDNLGFIKAKYIFMIIRLEQKNIDGIVMFQNQMIPSLYLLDGKGFKQFLYIVSKILMTDCDLLNILQNINIVMLYFLLIVPQGIGLVCTQSLSNKLSKFRIAATGIVLVMNHQFDIMKKLKLVGEPFKVIKNTEFIKGIFNSSLEVGKLSGGLIKTASGLRGHIKKPSKLGPDGSLRASFEDKIQMSDQVFCRTWVGLECMLRDFIDSQQLNKINENYVGIKIGETNIKIKRVPVKFAPLRIPNNFQQNLPFESKEKVKSLLFREKLRQFTCQQQQD